MFKKVVLKLIRSLAHLIKKQLLFVVNNMIVKRHDYFKHLLISHLQFHE